jgi:small subunit ribosomal protein S20
MPVTKSAKKALRKSQRRWLINEKRRRKIKAAVKNFLKAIKEKNQEKAKEYLKIVYKELDKAGKTFLHKNKVARLKSRYSQIFNKIFKSS